MQTYNYRAVKAIAEHRYPQIKRNHPIPSRPGPVNTWHYEWHNSIPDRPSPGRRKQRSNNRAPDSSRAA